MKLALEISIAVILVMLICVDCYGSDWLVPWEPETDYSELCGE